MLTTVDREVGRSGHRSPQILPGGKAVLFGIASPGSGEDPRIAVLNLVSREQRVLEQRGARARYLSSGHLVYVRDGTVFAVPFEPHRSQATGPQVVRLMVFCTRAEGVANTEPSPTTWSPTQAHGVDLGQDLP